MVRLEFPVADFNALTWSVTEYEVEQVEIMQDTMRVVLNYLFEDDMDWITSQVEQHNMGLA